MPKHFFQTKYVRRRSRATDHIQAEQRFGCHQLAFNVRSSNLLGHLKHPIISNLFSLKIPKLHPPSQISDCLQNIRIYKPTFFLRQSHPSKTPYLHPFSALAYLQVLLQQLHKMYCLDGCHSSLPTRKVLESRIKGNFRDPQ